MKNEENSTSSDNARRSRFNFSQPNPLSQPHLTGRKMQHTDKIGPLIFNVSSLLSDNEGARREYEYDQDVLPLSLEEGQKPAEATNIEGIVRFMKVRHDILTQGAGEADVVLECVRCLNDFDYHVNYELEEVFRPSIDVLSGIPVKLETEEDDADLKIDANHLLNLGEAIRQQILVSLPLRPVCGEDCPGLVAELERVNQQPSLVEVVVEEEEVPIDKRWEALSQLLKPEEN